MRVEFVKVSEQSCLARIARSDGAIIETTATAKDGIPHDLEHFIVEEALHCAVGFWGRVCQGAEFSNFRITRKAPRRRSPAWHRELTRGYNGWNEDLVTKVVRVYHEARRQCWSPPAAIPPVPMMALLLDPRRRPPAAAVFSKEALTGAAVARWEAEREWGRLPIGGALDRRWDDRLSIAAARSRTRDRRSRR